MWTQETDDYRTVLHTFQAIFNDNDRVEKIAKNWDRLVLLDSTDTGELYALVVKDQRIVEVKKVSEYDEDAEGLVHLQAEEEVLKDVFSGKYDPAAALVNGTLSVFSHERDKVKLEAIAFVMWKRTLG